MSGVLGITMNKPCWEDLQRAAAIIQPRGDEWGGFACLLHEKMISAAQKGKITPLLSGQKEVIMQTSAAIAHLSQKDSQPVVLEAEDTNMGPIAVAFDGKITNRQEIRKKSPYLVGSDAEIVARLIAAGKDPSEGIRNVFGHVKGPFSLVLLTLEGPFAARDTLGIRPLVLGRSVGGNGLGCAVASESGALSHINMEIIRDVKPGEVVEIMPTGFRTIDQQDSPGLILCGFEHGYWARPSSVIEGTPVGLARYIAGTKLAPRCPEADIIAGFPISGDTAAQGLAFATKIPFRSVFDLNTEAGGRSFLPFDPEKRAQRARDKLLMMDWAVQWKYEWLTEGLVVVLVDDSIVEGNQTLSRIFLIRRAGAKEVHLMIETPQMKWSCPFDITRRGSLMAATHSQEEMRKMLGVRTLAFNTPEDYAEAVISAQSRERKEKNPLTINNLCLGCFSGEFPKYE